MAAETLLESNGSSQDSQKENGQQHHLRATKLYDRQIRLWGWEAQQRLMNSRVLLYGINGVGAEVLKNLMLGGVRHIAVMDSTPVTEADFLNNFFLRRHHLGQNRASSSAENAKLLNSTCELKAIEKNIADFGQEDIKDYHLILLNNVPVAEAARVGEICRSLGIPIFVSQVVGFHAYFANDLSGQKFEIPPLNVPKPVPVPKAANGNGDSADVAGSSSQKTDNGTELQELSVTTPKIADILTKESAIRSGMASPIPKRMFGLKKIDPYLFLNILLHFVEKTGRFPAHATAEEDKELLNAIHKTSVLPGDTRVFVPEEFLTLEANMTSCMMGGTLAQELITVLTRRGCPIYNFYYLSAADATGTREYLE